MGPRPMDFNEQSIRQSPTMQRWEALQNGEKLKYACREFIKGQGDDEERLMRRIMIARRNNLRDHQTLKRARQLTSGGSGDANNKTHKSSGEEASSQVSAPAAKVLKTESATAATDTVTTTTTAPAPTTTTTTRRRRPSTLFSDAEVAKEMDAPAVEATRSYKTWLSLEDGAVFVYNQKYVKGQEGHDWLLRKNIWRRMRYRRENKKLVDQIRHVATPQNDNQSTTDNHHRAQRNDNGAGASASSVVASQIIDQTLLHPNANGEEEDDNVVATSTSDADNMSEAVEAAVKVAESYTQSAHYKNAMVHNPLEDTTSNQQHAATSEALDAAARLAAASGIDEDAVAAAAVVLV